MKGYIAIVLNKRDRQKLIKFALLEKKVAHHMTVVFEPDLVTYKKYKPRFGSRVVLNIVSEVRGRKGQAIIVKGFESQNSFAHITLSHASDKTAVYSNEVCRRCKRRSFPIQKVVGVLKYVRRRRR